jgi:mannosyltransferase OCH1-like enzyme
VYADVDMTCEKPIKPLLCQPQVQFGIGLSNTNAFEMNNGILIGKKGHPLLQHLINKIAFSLKMELK